MENLQAQGRWKKSGWNAEKLPGGMESSSVNAGHVDGEKGKRFEAAK